MNRYAVMSHELLSKGRAALAEGDLLQASEKGWGAAAHAVKAVAEHRGWRHDSHRARFESIDRLTNETGDGSIRDAFSLAQSLHMNFYENWLPANTVEAHLDKITELVAKLEPLAQ